jgi:8-oxo-dGTP pyrophosphatase MutT (NUDIX family)
MSGPAATAVLEQFVPPDPGQAALREEFLRHLADHSDGTSRRCRPDHITASVLVVDPAAERVLLTLHAKADAWFQLGGHVEDTDPDLVAAAAREAHEESGLADLILDPVPVHLDVHPVPFCGEGVRHLDVRFVAVAPDPDRARMSAESADLRWWPVHQLPGDDLADLVRLGRARVLTG